jgi:DNA-binding transcriptional LysR family regulator
VLFVGEREVGEDSANVVDLVMGGRDLAIGYPFGESNLDFRTRSVRPGMDQSALLSEPWIAYPAARRAYLDPSSRGPGWPEPLQATDFANEPL